MSSNNYRKKRKYPYLHEAKPLNKKPRFKGNNEECLIGELNGKGHNNDKLKDINSVKSNLVKKIELENVNKVSIEPEGNCFYRIISQPFFGTQEYHKEILKQIYEYANDSKENF